MSFEARYLIPGLLSLARAIVADCGAARTVCLEWLESWSLTILCLNAFVLDRQQYVEFQYELVEGFQTLFCRDAPTEMIHFFV